MKDPIFRLQSLNPQTFLAFFASAILLTGGTTHHLHSEIHSKFDVGMYHFLYVTNDGVLWGKGDNSYGQLGLETDDIYEPIPLVEIAHRVVAVAAGHSHSLFLTDEGTLYAMGWNNYGQLGAFVLDGSFEPVWVRNRVRAIAAHAESSYFIDHRGILWGMGRNTHGQLGNENNTRWMLPVRIEADVASVSAGWGFAMFIKDDGTLWGLGYNEYGQLGDGTHQNRSRPVLIDDQVVQVSCGTSHAHYIKKDGTLWAVGANWSGRLGDRTTHNRTRPVYIDSDVSYVAGGEHHTLYVKTDHTLWGMGDNESGELGHEEGVHYRIIYHPTPIQIDKNVLSAKAGLDVSYYLKKDGVLKGMGFNQSLMITYQEPEVYQNDGNRVISPAVVVATGLQGMALETDALHRFHNTRTGAYFFTAFVDEVREVIEHLPQWEYEGPTFTVEYGPESGNSPVYRFFNRRSNSHFYTISPNERDDVIANLSHQYTYEGIAFFARTESHVLFGERQLPIELIPVWRCYIPRTASHYFTACAEVVNYIRNHVDRSVMFVEGIAWFTNHVYPGSGNQRP